MLKTEPVYLSSGGSPASTTAVLSPRSGLYLFASILGSAIGAAGGPLGRCLVTGPYGRTSTLRIRTVPHHVGRFRVFGSHAEAALLLHVGYDSYGVSDNHVCDALQFRQLLRGHLRSSSTFIYKDLLPQEHAIRFML